MILLIDSYDSFTNNLSQLIIDNTGKEVITIHNDTFKPNEYEFFMKVYIPMFDYIVIGPGPGHPSNIEDVGIVRWILHYFAEREPEKAIPVLGICLGFQCLCFEFGNEVKKLEKVRHGQIYDVHPIAHSGGNDLYPSGDGNNDPRTTFPSVRYHSLYVDIDSLSDEIIPLAYCCEQNEEDNGHSRVLMAAKHKNLPFYGVQYHPESICSSKGNELISDFDRIATNYNAVLRQDFSITRDGDKQKALLNELINKRALHETLLLKGGKLLYSGNEIPSIHFKKIAIPLQDMVTPVDICEYLHERESNFFLLNSASVPGEWSIIGIPIEGQSEIITHSVDAIQEVTIQKYRSSFNETLHLETSEKVWNIIGDRMKTSYIPRTIINESLKDRPSREAPFFGGFIGLISYEEGQHIQIENLELLCNSPTPDVKLIFIERFMLYDHINNEWFIGSINLKADDSHWCDQLSEELEHVHKMGKLRLDINKVPESVKNLCKELDKTEIGFDFPSHEIYKKQFELCQEYLHSGNSYELCLTTQLKITLPSYIKPWDIYKVLTLRKNPSPFSCFMQFEDIVLVSSSPERFLSWKDDEQKNKMIELRPIKGTVKRTPEVDLKMASEILKTPKEMGENLMIVDLIRHDLHQFIDNVTVSQLMAVEEYKTVYQLVSVIQGVLKQNGYHGIDILHHSLPPGSMTGAPKKRSVELLQVIETLQPNGNPGGRRGIYSGVSGYWSVTDDSDWSVVIRSVYHYVDDKENQKDKTIWRIGAGGAITVLSDPEGEWEEMKLKLSSALQAFK
ncbi:unnamed protein product [Debaryomyces tyrocola]|nr:unnamed protein product [Debaryomyces tyrocola]